MFLNTGRSYQPSNKVNAYLNTQVTSATPEQLLLMVYDVAIVNCQNKNPEKVHKAITELISSLNFEYQDIALGLFRLYQYCQELVRKRNFEEAGSILKELRDTWALAFKNQKTAN